MALDKRMAARRTCSVLFWMAMATLSMPQCLRVAELQSLLEHLLCGRRRPSYIQLAKKPSAVVIMAIRAKKESSVSQCLSKRLESLFIAKPVILNENLPMNAIVRGILCDLRHSPSNKNNEPDKSDSYRTDSHFSPSDLESTLTTENIERVPAQNIIHLLGYTILMESERKEINGNGRTEVHRAEPAKISAAVNAAEAEACALLKDFALPKNKTAHTVVAVDCEMLQTASGSAVGRATLMDARGSLLVDRYVRPAAPVVDFLTEYSGLTAENTAAGISFEELQEELLKHIGTNTAVVGHGVEHDLRVLRIRPVRVFDTAYLFQSPEGYKMQLKQLSRSVLGEEIQQGAHDSCVDTLCALRLFAARVTEAQRIASGAPPFLLLGTEPAWLTESAFEETLCTVLSGANRLSRNDKRLFFVEISEETIEHCRTQCADSRVFPLFIYEENERVCVSFRRR